MRMKNLIRSLIVAGTIAGVGIIPAPAEAAAHPAAGVYEAIDNVDGSNLRLTVVGSASRAQVILFDDEATVACPVNDSPALGVGSGRWAGNTLDVSLRVICLGEADPGSFPITYVYDPATDTIAAGGDVYTRR